MKVRKSKDLKSVLEKKGFVLNPARQDHQMFILHINGQKQHIYTYLSHGIKEYGNTLMGKVRHQLKFTTVGEAEDFFDCPMSKDDYIKMLHKNGEL